MIQPKSFLAAGFLFCSAFAYCQILPSDISLSSEKAEQFKKELSVYLAKNAVYPQNAVRTGTLGDVVLSCELDSAGRFSAPSILKSPDPLLSTNSIISMNYLKKKWDPEELDCIPFGREYHFIFRYRIYMNVMPADIKSRAMKLFNEAKYEKAVKVFDRAIKDNEYDHELYDFRARCKEFLGDTEGAADDHSKAEKLRNETMAVINIITLGHTSTVRISGSRIVAVPVPGR